MSTEFTHIACTASAGPIARQANTLDPDLSVADTAIWERYTPAILRVHQLVHPAIGPEVVHRFQKEIHIDQMDLVAATSLNRIASTKYRLLKADPSTTIFAGRGLTGNSCYLWTSDLAWLTALSCGRAIELGADRDSVKTFHQYDTMLDCEKAEANDRMAERILNVHQSSKTDKENRNRLKQSLRFNKKKAQAELFQDLIYIPVFLQTGSYLPMEDPDMQMAAVEAMSKYPPFNADALRFAESLIKQKLSGYKREIAMFDSMNEGYEFMKSLQNPPVPKSDDQREIKVDRQTQSRAGRMEAEADTFERSSEASTEQEAYQLIEENQGDEARELIDWTQVDKTQEDIRSLLTFIQGLKPANEMSAEGSSDVWSKSAA